MRKQVLTLATLLLGLLGISEKTLAQTSICRSAMQTTVLSRLVQIQRDYQTLLQSKSVVGENAHLPVDPWIDGQRLVNPAHWQRAMQTHPLTPWLFYGEGTYNSWLSSLSFVRLLPSQLTPSLDLLQQIHRQVSRGFYYRGFEKNRIQRAKESGRISATERDALFARIDQGEILNFSQVNHENLAGKLRTDPADKYSYTGEYRLPNGDRVTDLATLQAFRKNPYFFVDESQVRAVTHDFYKVVIHFVKPENVEQLVSKVIAEMQLTLQMASGPEDIIRAVVQMQSALSAIHPFLDGNGRTIRLFADFIFHKYGLPPQLYPNENDWVMSQEQLVEICISGMEKYLELISQKKSSGF